MRALLEEGQAIRNNKRPLPEKPDFASRFEGSLAAEDVGRALMKHANPDAFIDAYVRWQLTSFDPVLPEMDDSAFAAFMDITPPMVENPRAKDKMLLIFHAAADGKPRSEEEIEHLRQAVGEMEERAGRAAAMNKPAIEFRDWVAAKLGESGPRPRQWLLERCAATIHAGWPANSIKGDISRQFSAGASDESFTAPQRQIVADQTRRLLGFHREFVDKVSFMADSTVKVTFAATKADREDVENWIKRLSGESQPQP